MRQYRTTQFAAPEGSKIRYHYLIQYKDKWYHLWKYLTDSEGRPQLFTGNQTRKVLGKYGYRIIMDP